MRVGSLGTKCEFTELLFNFTGGVGGGGAGSSSSGPSPSPTPTVAAKKRVGPQQSLRFDIEPNNIPRTPSVSVQGSLYINHNL